MQSTEARNKFCRLCLKKNTSLNNIFDEKDEALQNDVSKYIYLFFAVEITKYDQYSTYVCKSCWDILISMCKYRLKFRKNDALLRDTKTSTNNAQKQNIKVKFKVTPRCHESVKMIFVKYKTIKIPRNLWGVNLSPKVVIKNERTKIQKNRKRIVDHSKHSD